MSSSAAFCCRKAVAMGVSWAPTSISPRNCSISRRLVLRAVGSTKSGKVVRAGLRMLQNADARRAAFVASLDAAREGLRDGFTTVDEIEVDVAARSPQCATDPSEITRFRSPSTARAARGCGLDRREQSCSCRRSARGRHAGRSQAAGKTEAGACRPGAGARAISFLVASWLSLSFGLRRGGGAAYHPRLRKSIPRSRGRVRA
jgi:hypothetical protein